jgi:carbamoylphosphate synthase large subunit
MIRKSLLVLGASRYQLDAIRTGRQLGYRIITTDDNPSNPGHYLADKSYAENTIAMKAVLDIAKNENIDGVIAPCTDTAVPTAAYISEHLGLFGPPFKSATLLCDRLAFRQFLQENGFPSPEVHSFSDKDSPPKISMNSPWILKPNCSSGSKGVIVVQSEEELKEHLQESIQISYSKTAILEKYIIGHQGTCEGILKNGRIAFIFITDRQTVALPYVATHDHRVPTILSAKQQQDLLMQLARMWNLLEITDGPFDCDFVATNDQVYLLEATPRLGGNGLSLLVQKSTAFNLLEYSIKAACEDEYSLPEAVEPNSYAVILLGVERAGSLDFDENELKALQGEAWVDSVSLDYKKGDSVLPFINGRNRIGEAFTSAANRIDLDRKVTALRERLNLTVE